MSDDDLARLLTAAVRDVPGVSMVFPTRPVLQLAAGGIAATLDLPQPEVLVDIQRVDDFTTITAHIATVADISTPETLRAVGARLRDVAGTEVRGELAVNVKVRLIESPGH